MNVDGLYWHCEANKPKDYHVKVRQAFESNGLRILQFYEDEIDLKPKIVKSIVNAILGQTPKKIMARKCIVDDSITQKEAADFLKTNHLIGAVPLSSHLGLRDKNGTLVQLMSFRRHGDVLEISRSCGAIDTVVVGGFQKLLKHLTMVLRPNKIETLIDLRYADGHSLVSAGFVLSGIRTNYEYTNTKIRTDKRQFRVAAGVSEQAEATKKGWYRIYNAGRAKYILTPSLP
jgi:hypothetical protein